MNLKKLSILIPTYNRKSYLENILEEIWKQIKENNLENYVEVIVSDNGSIDGTKNILKNYTENLNYQYLINKKNLGPDKNFYNLIMAAKGEFLWILGDDEILKKNTILKIVNIILNEQDISYIFLKNKNKDKKYIFKNKDKYMKKISYEISFISSNIFNKSYIDFKIDYNLFIGTNLLQEAFYLQVLQKGNKFLFLEGDFFEIGRAENVGGYKFFKVFGGNQNEIFKFFNKNFSLSDDMIKFFNKKILQEFFPFHIIKYREKEMLMNWEEEDIKSEIQKTFSKYLDYWIYCYPLLIFNLGFSRRYFFLLRIFNRIKRLIK